MELETYAQVKTSVKKLLNINLDHYKDEQMRRRLDSWLVRCGDLTWEAYAHKLRTDPKELVRFRDYLTINVSAFFRDPERWQTLQDNYLPTLLREATQLRGLSAGLNVWSAGCSNGQEPYTLAMILDRIAPNRRHHILATDLDRGALARARARGPYPEEDLRPLTPQQRAEYLDKGGPPYYVAPKLASKVEFREHNMLQDAFPTGMDLIVCRNVVIYFTNDTKQELYCRFYNALRPGGLLFVGATEMIPRPNDIGFRTVGISFYQKS